jgi:hypothetical protein
MNVNRVTLSAFGTTGVLLAASLTMLAMVSALVTFDAWPSRDGGASADGIAIEQAPSAQPVRAVRHGRVSKATTSHRGRGGSAGARAGARLGGGSRDPRGAAPRDPSSPRVPSGPIPFVPATPPGEGDPAPGSPVHNKDHPEPSPSQNPVRQITCGAGGAVAGVNGGAGSAVGTACKTVPPSGSSGGDSFQPMVIVAALTHGGE